VRDLVLGGAIMASFVLAIATHVALLAGLVLRRPRWRAIVALVLPPMAPLWAWKAGMHARVVAWGLALLAYALSCAIAA
jgi:hypothetical protein